MSHLRFAIFCLFLLPACYPAFTALEEIDAGTGDAGSLVDGGTSDGRTAEDARLDAGCRDAHCVVGSVDGGDVTGDAGDEVDGGGGRQGGRVMIFSRTLPPGEIRVGQTYTLSWLVDSQTVLPATYRFRLIFGDPRGASESEWRAAAVLIPAGEHEIVRGSPFAVSAEVTVPAGSTRVQVSLEAQSTDGLFRRTSDPLMLETGSTPAVTDPRVIVSWSAAVGPFDPEGNPNPLRSAIINEMDGLQLALGTTATKVFSLYVAPADGVAGNYAYSAEIEDGHTAWEISSVTPARHADLGSGDSRFVTIQFRNNEADAASPVRYLVVRASHLPAEGGEADFVSLARVPIQGYAL